jgi:predicted nuclease of predicted toxin-antitoxin system
LATSIHFYLDENVPVAVANQLKRRHIAVVTARDLEALGESDASHLHRAVVMGAVFCTHDADFVDIAAQGISHTVLCLANSINMALAIGCVFSN